MMRVEPCLALPVSDLLTPVRAHARPVVVPYERGRCEADLQPFRLKPPADVHVVSGTDVHRVESIDFQERVPSERHVAPWYMLGDAVVEHDLDRRTRRACYALGEPWVVGGNDVRASYANHVRCEQRLHQVGEPVGVDADIRVRVGNDLAGGGREAGVPGGA